VENYFQEHVKDSPAEVYRVIKEQRERLQQAREKHGDYIPPDKW
jgi:phosphoenolpyruvate carboxykinase (GTP)